MKTKKSWTTERTFALQRRLVAARVHVQMNALDLCERLHEFVEAQVEFTVGQLIDSQPLTLALRDCFVPVFAVARPFV